MTQCLEITEKSPFEVIFFQKIKMYFLIQNMTFLLENMSFLRIFLGSIFQHFEFP